MHPPGELDGFADVAGAQLAAGVGSVTGFNGFHGGVSMKLGAPRENPRRTPPMQGLAQTNRVEKRNEPGVRARRAEASPRLRIDFGLDAFAGKHG
jgi:hypothetical protein